MLVILVLVAAGAGVAALLTHGFHSKTTVKYHQAAVFSLRVGDCIDQTSTGTKADVVSCTKPHDAEVFGTFQLTGAWPGAAAVRQRAGAGCATRLTNYLNPQLADSNLTQSYVFPGQQAWESGQRRPGRARSVRRASAATSARSARASCSRTTPSALRRLTQARGESERHPGWLSAKG